MPAFLVTSGLSEIAELLSTKMITRTEVHRSDSAFPPCWQDSNRKILRCTPSDPDIVFQSQKKAYPHGIRFVDSYALEQFLIDPSILIPAAQIIRHLRFRVRNRNHDSFMGNSFIAWSVAKHGSTEFAMSSWNEYRSV